MTGVASYYASVLDPRQQSEQKELVSRRRDPRRGHAQWLRRVRFWLGWTALLSLVLIVGAIAVYQPSIESLAAVFYGCLLLLPVSHVSSKMLEASIGNRAMRAGWFLCPWCRYELSSLPAAGICPECGAGYEREVCVTFYACACRGYQPGQIEPAKHEDAAWSRAIELRDGVVEP